MNGESVTTGRSILVLGVAAAVLLSGGVAFAAATSTHHAGAVSGDGVVAVQGNNTTMNQTGNATANLTFPNQTSNGTVVYVTNVTLPEGGFVGVHNDSLLQNRTVSSIIGVSSYLQPGTHENVSITLFNVSGANFTQTSLSPGNHTLIAMPHRDTNGNQSFDFVATNGAADGPYTFPNGTAVTDQATVEVTNGAAAGNVTNVTNVTNATNATNVTNATMNVTNETNSSVAE